VDFITNLQDIVYSVSFESAPDFSLRADFEGSRQLILEKISKYIWLSKCMIFFGIGRFPWK
jgi:hypothetical protein